MDSITIVVPGEVVPKQSVRVKAIPYFNDKKGKCDAFIKTYQKKKVTDYQEKVKICAMAEVGPDFYLWTGGISIHLTIVEKVLKTMPNKDHQFIAQGGIIYKITSPDLTDNLPKGIIDGLQGVIFANDGQICKTSSEKIYGFEPRAIITISKIDQYVQPKSFLDQ